jgi:hypothetical protein
MQQSVIGMFDALSRLDKADSQVTRRLSTIMETMLLPTAKYDETIAERDIVDLFCFKQRELIRISPVNISLLLGMFKFTARCSYKLDSFLQHSLHTALEVFLPSQW